LQKANALMFFPCCRSAAVHSGALTELRLGDLPWVKPQNLMQILAALSEW